MNSEGSPLCCCEFYDLNAQRNHILACCCNCEDVDEGFECLISGKEFPRLRQSRLMATLQDRIRVPWCGGAKRVPFDVALPAVIFPICMLAASISKTCTVISFTIMALIVLYMRSLPKSRFIFSWTVVSVLFLYIVLEGIVVPFLELQVYEHFILVLFVIGFVYFTFKAVQRTVELRRIGLDAAEKGNIDDYTDGGRIYSCNICQVTVRECDYHCVWMNTCIGKHNCCLYMLTLLCAESALLYGSNLTLTSACVSFTFYKTVLLPYDCSEVYFFMEYGVAFVSAVYCLILSVFVTYLLIRKVILIAFKKYLR